MKIIICHQYALAPHHAGVTRHFMLARELVLQGHDVTIVSAATSHKNPDACRLQKNEHSRYETYDGVKFLWLRAPSPASGKVKRVLNMISFARSILSTPFLKALKTEKPDIVIGNSPDLFTAVAATWIARRYNAPYVLHMGDIWPQSLVDIGGISKFHPFILLLTAFEKFLYKKSRLIITPLPFAGGHVEKNGGRAADVVCIPITIDLAAMPNSPLPDNKVFTFVFAGAHGPGNGVEGIIRAVAAFEKQYPDKQIEVCLIGAGALKKDLKILSDAMGVNSIVFKSAVAKSDMHQALVAADAFIVNIPDFEIFRTSGISPNKLYDFMAMSRPIVIGCSASNNPVLEAGAGMVAPADDADALARVMAEMIAETPEKRERMARAGRAYVEKNNDVRKVGVLLGDALAALSTQETLPLKTRSAA